MISVGLGEQLKAAGLQWQPAKGDLFGIPDRGMDNQTFVVTDMAVIPALLQGEPAMTFHGTPEWALDYIHTGDVVWLPSEEQLRSALEQALAAGGVTVYDLIFLDRAYTCRFEWRGESLAFREHSAADAYAAGLLHVLDHPAG